MVTSRIHEWLWIGFLLAAIGCGAKASAKGPQDLESCYMNVALTKANADMAYLAREICDALFKPQPRALFLLSGKTGRCHPWWFDARGQHQTSDRLCIVTARGESSFDFACEALNGSGRPYVAKLRAKNDYLEPQDAKGTAPGKLFLSMQACLSTRLK